MDAHATGVLDKAFSFLPPEDQNALASQVLSSSDLFCRMAHAEKPAATTVLRIVSRSQLETAQTMLHASCGESEKFPTSAKDLGGFMARRTTEAVGPKLGLTVEMPQSLGLQEAIAPTCWSTDAGSSSWDGSSWDDSSCLDMPQQHEMSSMLWDFSAMMSGAYETDASNTGMVPMNFINIGPMESQIPEQMMSVNQMMPANFISISSSEGYAQITDPDDGFHSSVKDVFSFWSAEHLCAWQRSDCYRQSLE